MQAAIAELGFVRNESARQLRAGASRAVGLVVIDAANPFFSDVARGVEDTVQAAGGVVLLGNSAGDSERENRYLELFEQQRVRGVLIAPTGDTVPPLELPGPSRDPGRVPGPLPRGRRLLERQRRRRRRWLPGGPPPARARPPARSRSSAGPPRCGRCATGARVPRRPSPTADGATLLAVSTPALTIAGRAPGRRGAGSPAGRPAPDGGLRRQRPAWPSASSPVSPTRACAVPEDVAIVGLRRHRVRRRRGGAAVVRATAPCRARPARGRAAVRGDPPA